MPLTYNLFQKCQIKNRNYEFIGEWEGLEQEKNENLFEHSEVVVLFPENKDPCVVDIHEIVLKNIIERRPVLSSIVLEFSRKDYDMWAFSNLSVSLKIGHESFFCESLSDLEKLNPIFESTNGVSCITKTKTTVFVELMHPFHNQHLLVSLLYYHPIKIFINDNNTEKEIPQSISIRCKIKGFFSDFSSVPKKIGSQDCIVDVSQDCIVEQSVIQVQKSIDPMFFEHDTWYVLDTHGWNWGKVRYTHSIFLQFEDVNMIDALYYIGDDDGDNAIERGALTVRYGTQLKKIKTVSPPVFFSSFSPPTGSNVCEKKKESNRKENDNKGLIKLDSQYSHNVYVKCMLKNPLKLIKINKQYNVCTPCFRIMSGVGGLNLFLNDVIQTARQYFSKQELEYLNKIIDIPSGEFHARHRMLKTKVCSVLYSFSCPLSSRFARRLLKSLLSLSISLFSSENDKKMVSFFFSKKQQKN